MISKFLVFSFLLNNILCITCDHLGTAWPLMPTNLNEAELTTSLNHHREPVLETHSITAHGRQIRSSNNHILQSPLDEIHFNPFVATPTRKPDEAAGVFWHRLGKRSVEMVDNKDESKDNESFHREARGATKEQWIKQPYPVKDSNDDQRALSSSGDDLNVRAPRVHFVTTQKRSDDDRKTTTRTTRMYESNRGDYDRRRTYDRYDTDYPRYRYNEYDLGYNQNSVPKKQRIIYYATLPEVVRTPPNVDLRYRSTEPLPPPGSGYPPPYDYFYNRPASSPMPVNDPPPSYYDREGRYDIPPTFVPRYYSRRYPPPYPPAYGSYHSSKFGYDVDEHNRHYHQRRPAYTDNYRPSAYHSNNDVKQRLTDNSGSVGGNNAVGESDNKRQFNSSPVKISTGVNVKENDRKVPERRIYADREREYVYAPPSFQLADDDETIDNYTNGGGDSRRY